jgi:hypothetical protein
MRLKVIARLFKALAIIVLNVCNSKRPRPRPRPRPTATATATREMLARGLVYLLYALSQVQQ